MLGTDKIFTKIFSRPPYIIDGDYYYFSPHYENASDDVKKLYEQIEKNIFKYGLANWKERTFQDDFNSFAYWMIQMYEHIDDGFSKINEIFGKIAAEGKPFMDISSSNSFGMIPFIAKMNPQITCMATDIDSYMIKILRSFINQNLSKYNIKLAAFDNYDIPIKDNSLDYITSTFGIASSYSAGTQNRFYNLTAGKEKPINEIYRILKPGGRFITIESVQDWNFNLTKTHEAYNRHGKLFGQYTYDEIEEVQNKLKVSSWRDLFIAAGFEIEIEEKYLQKSSGLEIKTELYPVTNSFKIREWTAEEKDDYFSSAKSIDRKNFDDEVAVFGIEYAQGEIFYVLRKIC